MPIKIQQDHAQSQRNTDNGKVIWDGTADGWNIMSSNNPDFNVLNLDIFNSIKSVRHKSSLLNINELIGAVLKARDDTPICKLDNIFITQQKHIESTMLHKRDTNYKILLIQQEKLRSTGKLQRYVICLKEVVEIARMTKSFII